MNKQNISIALAVILSVISLIFTAVHKPAIEVTELGSTTKSVITAAGFVTTGSFSSATATFSGQLTVDRIAFGGSGLLDLGTATTSSTTAAQICNYPIIDYAPRYSSSTVGLPTAATLIADCLPEIGDYKDVWFRNTGATASTTQFDAGLGVSILSSTSSDPTVYGGQRVLLRFTTASSTGVDLGITIFK
jgi:hypothetical protein